MKNNPYAPFALVIAAGIIIGFAAFVALAIAFPRYIFGPQQTLVTETPAEPTPVPTPEIYYTDYHLGYPEGVPPQGIDIEIRAQDNLSLVNTSLSVYDTEIVTGQPGIYHIDPSEGKNNSFNITIRSFNQIDNDFDHTDLGDIDYFTFTLLPN